MPRRLRLLLIALSTCGVLAAAPAASAAPGDLDPSFGAGGSVRLLPSEEAISVQAVAVQPDLKIVMGGSEEPGSVILVRLLPSGELDPSFGAGGKVTTPFPGGFGEARAIALQPDGKIVIAGSVRGMLNSEFLIGRYNGDGSPDASFGGGDGIQVVPIEAGDDQAEAVAIGAGGRILVTGETDLPGEKRGVGIAVLKPEGELDAGFAGDGTTAIDASADDSDEGVAIAELPDGGILVGDSSGDGAGDGFTLVQLDSSGLPDPGFGGGDGIVKTPIPGGGNAEGRITDFVLRPDGRIVASGDGYDENLPANENSLFAAVGYLANGDLDPSFAKAGIFTRRVGPGDNEARAIEMTPSGRLLLAGSYDPEPSNASPALLRLDSNGALDPSFGSGGQVLRGVQAPFGEIFQSAALDAEERLVVLSTAYLGGGNTEIVVSRYLGDKVPALPLAAPTPEPKPNQRPHARMNKVPKKVAAEELKGFSGTASDADGNGVQRVQVAVVKRMKRGGGARASAGAKSCNALKNGKPRFKRFETKAGKCTQLWLNAKGTAKWNFKLKGELPPGRYVVFARAIDGKGEPETEFSRKLGNRYAFHVLPSR